MVPRHDVDRMGDGVSRTLNCFPSIFTKDGSVVCLVVRNSKSDSLNRLQPGVRMSCPSEVHLVASLPTKPFVTRAHQVLRMEYHLIITGCRSYIWFQSHAVL